jgi:hypothetical protein
MTTEGAMVTNKVTNLCRTSSVAIAALMLALVEPASAQPSPVDREGAFIAYEVAEMTMNQFRNFAGEVGYRFRSPYQARLTIMEVDLTERHLSSSWESAAVDGRNVTGYFRGYELHVDRFLLSNLYVSANVGYYADTYTHTQLPDRVKNKTFTVGSGVGYSRPNIFGIQHLHFNFNVPVRYYFNRLEETQLGDATVREHVVVNNMWLFIGYRF